MEREQSNPLDILIVLALIVAAAIAFPHVRNAIKPVMMRWKANRPASSSKRRCISPACP